MLFILLKSLHHGTEIILFSYAACVGSNEYSLHVKNIFINEITGSSMQCSFWEIESNNIPKLILTKLKSNPYPNTICHV